MSIHIRNDGPARHAASSARRLIRGQARATHLADVTAPTCPTCNASATDRLDDAMAKLLGCTQCLPELAAQSGFGFLIAKYLMERYGADAVLARFDHHAAA